MSLRSNFPVSGRAHHCGHKTQGFTVHREFIQQYGKAQLKTVQRSGRAYATAEKAIAFCKRKGIKAEIHNDRGMCIALV